MLQSDLQINPCFAGKSLDGKGESCGNARTKFVSGCPGFRQYRNGTVENRGSRCTAGLSRSNQSFTRSTALRADSTQATTTLRLRSGQALRFREVWSTLGFGAVHSSAAIHPRIKARSARGGRLPRQATTALRLRSGQAFAARSLGHPSRWHRDYLGRPWLRFTGVPLCLEVFLETCRARSTGCCFHVLGVRSAAHHSPKAGEYGGRGIVGWAGSQSGGGAGGASHGCRQCRAHRGGDL